MILTYLIFLSYKCIRVTFLHLFKDIILFARVWLNYVLLPVHSVKRFYVDKRYELTFLYSLVSPHLFQRKGSYTYNKHLILCYLNSFNLTNCYHLVAMSPCDIRVCHEIHFSCLCVSHIKYFDN